MRRKRRKETPVGGVAPGQLDDSKVQGFSCRDHYTNEIDQLMVDVARLEAALTQVLAASDDVLIDLRRAQRERAQLAQKPRAGFADAWFNTEPSPPNEDNFFTLSEVDVRARRWLLTSN